jgi:signal transduction histidine kinase
MRQIAELLAPGQWESAHVEAPEEQLAGAFVALVGSGVERSTAEWTLLRSTGALVPVQLSVTPRFDEIGAQIGHLFVANDISAAREVAKLKDEFVGLISHELRTPLSSIIGYLELLRDEDEDPLTESQLHYLAVAERNAHRLLHLVGDLLFAAQVESGSFRLEQSEVDLIPILNAAIETARPASESAGVTFRSEFADKVFVDGDPVRLGQAVDNLVSNAVKFTPRGGTITLSLAVEDDKAVLSVRDTGLGIAAAEMDKLFSRFFRATTATANAVAGVGLGLTITKAIVTAHNGTMEVESEEGVGTCFRMTLPLQHAAAEPVPAN